MIDKWKCEECNLIIDDSDQKTLSRHARLRHMVKPYRSFEERVIYDCDGSKLFELETQRGIVLCRVLVHIFTEGYWKQGNQSLGFSDKKFLKCEGNSKQAFGMVVRQPECKDKMTYDDWLKFLCVQIEEGSARRISKGIYEVNLTYNSEGLIQTLAKAELDEMCNKPTMPLLQKTMNLIGKTS